MQGYLFARPMLLGEVLEQLGQHPGARVWCAAEDGVA
ncbi:MAG: hypothetical protein JWQ80_2307 [Massilia sp.]|nr:hypothetical protein [Massilia sp.]